MAQLLGEISSRELSEWVAYAELEPFGPQREDWRMAMIVCTVINAVRGKGQRALQPGDVLGDGTFGSAEDAELAPAGDAEGDGEGEQAPTGEAMPWEQQKAIVMMWHAALGGGATDGRQRILGNE
ncbi:MAG: hypothetical protein WC718_18920 [Phycisphaerales bacterium]